MRLQSAILTALIVVAFLVTVPVASSQSAGEAEMKVSAQMSVSGIDPLEGKGSVKLTYAGAAAAGLRLKVFEKFDNGNQYLDVNETRNFLTAVCDGLIGKSFWGITIKSTTNFSRMSNTYIVDHTNGLVPSAWNSEEPIWFTTSFEGSGQGSSKEIQTVQGAYDTFTNTVDAVVGYEFNGTISVENRVSTYMVGSLTSPNLNGGKIQAIRTPWGEILWYSYEGHIGSSEPVDETLAFEPFSAMENQQIAFVVLFIGCLMILRMPGQRFDKFEKLHPRKFRKYAKPLIPVRLSAYVLAAVLVVLYLFPFIFSFVSRDALLYSAYLYILVPVAVIAESIFSRIMYDKAAVDIPEEGTVEIKQALIEPAEGEGEILCKICYRPIEKGLDMLQCVCGLIMHTECAEKEVNCPSCGQPLVQLRTRSIQCKSCGETFLYSGEEDVYSIQCTKCGAFQEEIKAGKNYLVADAEPRNAFMMIHAMALSGRPTLCLTTAFPGKIRSDYEMGDITIKWFSDSSTDIDNLNPRALDGDAMESVSTFLMTTKAAGVLVDGIDVLIEMNGFDKVLSFVKRLNDLAAIHGSTILLSVNKHALQTEQYKALSDEFDEIHDYQ